MLHNLLCILFTAFWTVLLSTFGLFHALLAWKSPYVTFIASRLWAPPLLWIGGVKLSVEGLENIPQNQPVIFASNHQSTVDIPVLFSLLPLNVRFIAKHVLGYVPFMGWYLHLAGFILINRSNRKKAIAQLERAAERIRSGTSIIVFPEGTRSQNGQLLPFKKGAFNLALKAGVPICPIAIHGSGQLMPKNSWNIKPGPIHVKIGPPVHTDAFQNTPLLLAEHIRQHIAHLHLAIGGQGDSPPPPAPSLL